MEKIVISSEKSVQIQFPQKICEEVNEKISLAVEKLKSLACRIPEIQEIVPAYCAVTVYFDCRKIKIKQIFKFIKKALEEDKLSENKSKSAQKIVEIPVCYEEEFAPDLQDVADFTGLSKQEVIEIHKSKEYLIYMLGFLPGFPYLGGMDERLETPRLETPRTKIPAGSIAIGGKQTGLYPSESPGGWRIIGRTPLKVFDQNENPACIYEAGDKIRFVSITKKQFLELEEKKILSEKAQKSHLEKQRYVCTSGMKILEGGMLTSVQDYGRKGFQHSGIAQSGVMDEESYSLVNKILGNLENAACLEMTVLGPEIQFTNSCEFAITGGECHALLDNVQVPMNTKIKACAGSILKCGFIEKGIRSYLGVKGGILVPEVLGSRSTNLKSKMGGYYGRKLKAGDELAIGNFFRKSSGKKIRLPEPSFLQKNDVLILNCTKGSQYESFSDEAVKKFQTQIFTVLPESDRMGIRFGGENLQCGRTDIISDAIPFGAVQITSAGLPVVMAADRQTTGGYAKIAAVTAHSMCMLVQAVPGTKVQFKIDC